MSLKSFILSRFALPLSGKRLYWSDHFRLFTDGGYPVFRWLPRIRKAHYHPHWGLWGYCVYWLGREFHFIFGRDTNHLYKDL